MASACTALSMLPSAQAFQAVLYVLLGKLTSSYLAPLLGPALTDDLDMMFSATLTFA